jgi:hypothetical protein
MPRTTMVKYLATPTGYVAAPASRTTTPGVVAPSGAGGSFESFPPGCGSGGTCDWATYNAQQAALAGGGLPGLHAPSAAGGGAITSSGGGGGGGGVAPAGPTLPTLAQPGAPGAQMVVDTTAPASSNLKWWLIGLAAAVAVGGGLWWATRAR